MRENLSAGHQGDADPHGAARAKLLIDASSNRRLDVDRLAAESNLSKFHFIRLFRRHFFTTPHQYLLRRRIEMARELLSSSDLSVTEICLEVGFESLGSFSTTFHRIVGWAPSAYRARSVAQRTEPKKHIPGCFWVMHNLEARRDISPIDAELPTVELSNSREAR